MMDARLSPLYLPTEAARLVGLSASTVRRWLAPGGPVVRDATHYASFLDLIELYMVAGLRKHVPLRRLKEAVHDAAQRLGIDHPLARQTYLRDGGHLFLEMEGALLHLGRAGQLAFPGIIRPRAEHIVFAEDGIAARWYPLGRDRTIVVHPGIMSGAVTIEGTRIDTRTIAGMVDTMGSVEKVASIYELQVHQVETAWIWERRLAA